MSIQSFHSLRNISEQEDRRFYYLYNENFSETQVSDNEVRGLGLDAKLCMRVYKIYQWYRGHVQGFNNGAESKVVLLTSNA